jgi:copper homeostasis protein
MRVAVEICVTSVAEALAAERAGADSVEICTWLACGGVTPSSGLVDAVRTAVRIPARVLVRPTPDGFVYDPASLHALLLDAEIFGGGAIGLVTGALKPNWHQKVSSLSTALWTTHVIPWKCWRAAWRSGSTGC